MNKLAFRLTNFVALPLLALTCAIGCSKAQQPSQTVVVPAPQPAPTVAAAPDTASTPAASTTKTAAPAWESNAVIYCVYPQIFSSHGLKGVAAALPRLKALGVNVLWMMPFQPLGHNVTVGGVAKTTLTPPTPYCQDDPKGIDPAEGTAADLTKLMASAHAAGMHVILDVCINQTAWSSPLVTSHPEYYYHSDNNPTNLSSIEPGFPNGFRDADIAGIDLRNDAHGAQSYMKGMLQYWITTFKFDGFRLDSADSPAGPTRDLSQEYAQELYSSINPDNTQMWLEEGNVPSLAFSPYNLDYNWDLSFYAANGGSNYLLQGVAKSGAGVAGMEAKYSSDLPGGSTGFPAGFKHMTFLQDWDTPQDYSMCGGFSQILPAAAFNLTLPGVPLIYNGEEVGNDKGDDHLNHTAIDWNSPNASRFSAFYKTMLAVRRANPALGSDGSLTWTKNSAASDSVATYQRLSGSNECYVEINFSGKPQSGTIGVPGGIGAWSDISPSVSPGHDAHPLPSAGKFKLAAYDYAVFRRTAANVPAVPTSQIAGGAAATGDSNGSANLTGTLTTVTSPTAFNLTTLGTSDWAAWGYGGSNLDFDDKSTGGGKIANVTPVGGSLNAFDSKYAGFTWTDGKPDASATNETKGYYNQGGKGDGFQFTVPATTAAQTLVVYVGGYSSGGAFSASLSDGSPAYVNSSLTGPGTSYYGYYTLTFKSPKPGQKLTVKWVQKDTGTNVTLYAATLK